MNRRTIVTLSAALCCSMLLAAALFAKKDDDTTSLEGKAAPAFSAITIAGDKVSLESEKGNVVLMDFWATWCPPCRKSLPHIQELSADKALAAKGLKVWAVQVPWNGETKEKADAFVKKNKYTFTVPMDTDNAASKEFMANAIPTTVLIGRDGTVKKVWIGFNPDSAAAMKKTIEDALNEKKAS